MLEHQQKRSSRAVMGIAGAKIELERAECERIERILREGLQLREDLPAEQLERHVARAVMNIAGAKAAMIRLGGKAGFRNVGRRQAEKDRSKLASDLKTFIRALDSAHKPLLDALAHAGSKLGIMRFLLDLEAELGIIRAADLSAVPANPGPKPGRQRATFSAQPQRALTFLLADIYLDLSGEYPEPSKKRYGFHAFADAMFAAMQTKPPSRYIVEAACKFVRKK